MKPIIFFLIFATTLHAQVASTLLDTFQFKCPNTFNSSMSNVYQLNQRLQLAYKTIKEDPACKDLYGEINHLAQISNDLANYEIYRQTKNEKIKAEKNISLYNQLLVDPSFADQSPYLAEQIITAKKDLVSYNNDVSFYENYKNSNGEKAYYVVNSIQNFLQSAANSPQCYNSSSAKLTSFVGNALQIGSAFLAPGSAVALAAGGSLINGFSSFINQHKISSKLKEIDDVNLSVALRCVTEAFTSQYCENSDALELIEVYKTAAQESSRLEGLNIVTSHMDYSLKNWLLKLYAGGVFTTDGNLFDREKPIAQIQFVQDAERDISQEEYEKTPQIEEKFSAGVGQAELKSFYSTIVSRFANEMINTHGSTGFNYPNPFSEAGYTAQALVYTLHNKELRSVPNCAGDNECTSLVKYLEFKGVNIDRNVYRTMLANTKDIINSELNRLEIARQLTNSDDPLADIVDSFTQTGSTYTAYKTLSKVKSIAAEIKAYLLEQAEIFDSSTHDSDDLINHYWIQAVDVEETYTLSNEMIQMTKSFEKDADLYIPEVCIIPDSSDDPKECNSKDKDCSPDEDTGSTDLRFGISANELLAKDKSELTEKEKAPFVIRCGIKILKLDQRQSEFFFSKIRNMVKYDLQAKLENGEFDDNFEDIILLSQGDILEALKNSHPGSPALSKVRDDIQIQQNKLFQTYSEYFELFKKLYVQEIESSKNIEVERDLLCFASLSQIEKLDRKTKKKILKLCKDREIKGFYDENSVSWNDYVGEDLSEQMCAVNDYYDREKILDNKFYGDKSSI